MAAKGKGVVIYVLFGAGAMAGTGVPSQSLPFQKILLENIPVWELLVPPHKILTSDKPEPHWSSNLSVH